MREITRFNERKRELFFTSSQHRTFPYRSYGAILELQKKMSLALWLNKSKTRSQTEDDEVIKELQSNESSAVCDQRNETQASSSSVRSTSHPASSKSNESFVCDKQASSSSVTSHPKSKNRFLSLLFNFVNLSFLFVLISFHF